MSDKDMLRDWMYQAAAYELLALAFLPPSRELSDALTLGEFADACEETLKALKCTNVDVAWTTSFLSEYEKKESEVVFHELRKEYTYLFVGEREPLVTPFVGIWSAQQRGQKGLYFVGKESIEIEHFMRRCGVAKNLKAGHSNDPVDHVGTICEFLKFLCLINAQAIQIPEETNVKVDDFEIFLSEHFTSYAEWCSAQVYEKARCPFYKAMGLLLGAICEQSAKKIASENCLVSS